MNPHPLYKHFISYDDTYRKYVKNHDLMTEEKECNQVIDIYKQVSAIMQGNQFQ